MAVETRKVYRDDLTGEVVNHGSRMVSIDFVVDGQRRVVDISHDTFVVEVEPFLTRLVKASRVVDKDESDALIDSAQSDGLESNILSHLDMSIVCFDETLTVDGFNRLDVKPVSSPTGYNPGSSVLKPKQSIRREAYREAKSRVDAAGYTLDDVRKWGESNGIEVPWKGMIKASVMDAFLNDMASDQGDQDDQGGQDDQGSQDVEVSFVQDNQDNHDNQDVEILSDNQENEATEV